MLYWHETETMEIHVAHNNMEIAVLNENGDDEEPRIGMSFSSKDDVYAFYAKFAKLAGFSIAYRTQCIGENGELRYFTIECSRAGKKKSKSEVNPLKPSLTTKIDCKAKIRASAQKDGRFMLSTVILEHNHELLPVDSRNFRINKIIDNHVKRRLETNDLVGIGVAKRPPCYQLKGFQSRSNNELIESKGKKRNLKQM